MKIIITPAEFDRIVSELLGIIRSDMSPSLPDSTPPEQVIAAWRAAAPNYVRQHLRLIPSRARRHNRSFYERCRRENDRTARFVQRLLKQAK